MELRFFRTISNRSNYLNIAPPGLTVIFKKNLMGKYDL